MVILWCVCYWDSMDLHPEYSRYLLLTLDVNNKKQSSWSKYLSRPYVKCWVNDNTKNHFTLFVTKALQIRCPKETTTHPVRMFKIRTQTPQCQLGKTGKQRKFYSLMVGTNLCERCGHWLGAFLWTWSYTLDAQASSSCCLPRRNGTVCSQKICGHVFTET